MRPGASYLATSSKLRLSRGCGGVLSPDVDDLVAGVGLSPLLMMAMRLFMAAVLEDGVAMVLLAGVCCVGVLCGCVVVVVVHVCVCVSRFMSLRNHETC